MMVKSRNLILAVLFGLTAEFTAFSAYAQDVGPAAIGQPEEATVSKAEKKAQAKVMRKQARAKKNAELKKLEDAGYNPSKGNDPNYPQDLQNAQKKAGIGAQTNQ
jgi:hypothetical protein